MPGPRALRLSRGASDREEDSMPSGPVDGASDGDAHIFSPPQQDQEEVSDTEAEDSHRIDSHAPELEVERIPVPRMSPPSAPPHVIAAATADTPGPSYTAQHSPQHIQVSLTELTAVMDDVCSLATTQAA